MIPNTAVLLDNLKLAPVTSFSSYKRLDIVYEPLSKIVSLLHKEGVNARHLGRVRAHCKLEETRKMIFMESIARTLKVLLRELFREKTSLLSIPSEDPFKEIASLFLNLVFGVEPPAKSESFWQECLLPKAASKFPGLMPEGGATVWRQYLSRIEMIQTVIRFLQISSVQLEEEALSKLLNASSQFSLKSPFNVIFYNTDILSIETLVKHTGLVSYASGMALAYKATKVDYRSSYSLAARAKTLLLSAASSMGSNAEGLLQLIQAFQMVYTVSKDVTKNLKLKKS